jgi:hypothetical protein
MNPTNKKYLTVLLTILAVVPFVNACNQSEANTEIPQTQSTSDFPPTVTNTLLSSPTSTSNPTPLPTETLTPTITPTQETSEPEGCLQPEENYDLKTINGMLINQRTFSMLEQAQTLYGGELEITGYHITQGSYTNQVSASFGTHAGGGAVDISVIQYGTYEVLYDDIEPLIQALRTAGFAAWLRDFDQLYPGSPIHIHAIAIGDRDLSPAAQEQLTGEFGYFSGYNGLPQPEGDAPVQDEHGGPIMCKWMVEMGYEDLSILDP